MPASERKFFYGWWVVAGAWISTFVCSSALSSFNIFGPELAKPIVEGGLGQSRGMLSGAYSLDQIVMAIFGLIAGLLVDRIGLRKLMIIASSHCKKPAESSIPNKTAPSSRAGMNALR